MGALARPRRAPRRDWTPFRPSGFNFYEFSKGPRNQIPATEREKASQIRKAAYQRGERSET